MQDGHHSWKVNRLPLIYTCSTFSCWYGLIMLHSYWPFISYHTMFILALYFLSYYAHIGPLFLIILCPYWPFISYHTMLILALYFLSYYAHIGPLFLIILCSYWPFISYTMLILALYFYSVWNKILSVDRQLGCLHQIYQGPKEMLMAPSLSDTGNMGPVWGVWFWKIWSKILHSECHLS